MAGSEEKTSARTRKQITQPKRSRFSSWFGVILSLILLIALFTAFGPPRLMEKTNSADFCASCHVMETEYNAWIKSSHQRIECVECHLPNDNLFLHYLWKGIDGTRDLVLFYSGRVPKEIHASTHAKTTVKNNCIKCHAATVSRMNTERTCWECHRSFLHKQRFAKPFFREN